MGEALTLPVIHIDCSHPGYEKGWDTSDDCAVYSDDWPDPWFEGDLGACRAYVAAEVAAGRAAFASHQSGDAT